MPNVLPSGWDADMTESREELRHWDGEIVWHAFTQMAEYEPLLIERAHGCILVDVDGREYLDGVSSLWCNVHGHAHPRLNEAIRQQLERVAHVTSLGMSNPTTVRLAKRLVDAAPGGLRHVFFSSDGSSAVEVALKIAFQYWRQCSVPNPRKTKYVAFGDAYHGDTLGSVSVGGVDRFNEMFRPLLFDVIRLPLPDCYRLPSGVTRETACGFYLDQLESCLRDRHDEIAAVIIEPLVQGAAGMVVHPEGLLAGIRRLTQQYGVLLIADEVAVGFGRTGKMFACQHEHVTPDLMCLGKGLTAGYLPMAATLTTDEIWNAFLGRYAEARTFFHGHTYGGNPLAAAVALASLDVFDEERTLEHLPVKIERLREHLSRIARLDHVGDVRQCGLMAGVELVRDRTTAESYPWHERRGGLACIEASRHGVWLRPLGDVVVIMPPLSVSLDELDQICAAVEAGIATATA
jgi:adenosylmethionine---8-amino-7-oxononanoate aminotransferase